MPQYAHGANDSADSGSDEQRDDRPCPNRFLEVAFPAHDAIATVLECVAGGVADLFALLLDRFHDSPSRFPYLMHPCAGVIGNGMDNCPDVFRNIGRGFTQIVGCRIQMAIQVTHKTSFSRKR
jgi:hypothetical protein